MIVKRKYLFHITDGRALNKIMSDGFIMPKYPYRSYYFPLCFFRPKAVYLTENPMHWLFIQNEYSNIFILKIKAHGLQVSKDFQHGVVDYMFLAPIPISEIEEIYNLKEFIINDELKMEKI